LSATSATSVTVAVSLEVANFLSIYGSSLAQVICPTVVGKVLVIMRHCYEVQCSDARMPF
jgi:hypothetical protein